MKRIFIIICILLTAVLLVSCSSGDQRPKEESESTDKISLAPWFTKQSFGEGESVLPYWLYVPENVEENMPLIVVLHCSYMKSEDSLGFEENLDTMTDPEKKDITSFIYNGEFGKIPAYVIMPQISAASRGWAKRGEELNLLISSLKNEYGIDEKAISLIGYSMGGTGALELASAYPEVFSRVVALAGGLDGVSNNNIPYVRGEGRMQLSDEFFPELRIPTGKEAPLYEPEKMKFAYAAEGSSAFAESDEEKAQALEFKNKRTEETAECFKKQSTSVWLLIGENDAEVSPSVSEGIFNILGDAARCDIIAECGHSGILNTAIEKNEEIIDFLVN